MIEKPFVDQFPRPLPKDPEDVTRQWIEAHADDLSTYNEALEYVAASNNILEAEGLDLDEVGKDYGVIGQRRGRGDDEYRALLLSIANAYSGRGTPTGMRYAIGAGVQARPDEVTITDHFDHNAYSVTLHDWITHETTTIDMLADLADPSGVELYNPGEGAEVAYQAERTGIGFGALETGLGPVTTSEGGVGFGARPAEAVSDLPGFGAGRFDGADPFGDAGGFGAVSAQESADEDGADGGEDSETGE